METKKHIEWVRQIRTQNDLSQDGLAIKSGVSQSTISAVERGSRPLTVDTIYAICKAMKIDFVTALRDTGFADMPLDTTPTPEFQVVLDAIDVMTPDEREGFLIYLGRIAQRAKRRKP